MAREAGRGAQISAVKHLLRIPIDHFVEITLAALLILGPTRGPLHTASHSEFAPAGMQSTFTH